MMYDEIMPIETFVKQNNEIYIYDKPKPGMACFIVMFFDAAKQIIEWATKNNIHYNINEITYQLYDHDFKVFRLDIDNNSIQVFNDFVKDFKRKSGGVTYGSSEITTTCPYCGEICHADWVDIGVGYTQAGPYHCYFCNASEIGPYDNERELTTIEKKTSWYKPHSSYGSSANVVGGKLVGWQEALDVYRDNYEFILEQGDAAREFIRSPEFKKD